MGAFPQSPYRNQLPFFDPVSPGVPVVGGAYVVGGSVPAVVCGLLLSTYFSDVVVFVGHDVGSGLIASAVFFCGGGC